MLQYRTPCDEDSFNPGPISGFFYMDSSKFYDKSWRVNNLYKIVDKDARLIRFKERSFQRKIRLSRARRKLVLKYRQGGVTTGCSIDVFDHTIFTPNTTSAIIAHKQKDIHKIFEIVRTAHKHMAKKIKPKLAKGGGSKYELQFPDIGSKIYVDIEVRGETLHRAHISEAAFCDPKRLKATLGAIPPNASVTFESTPNGMGNDFYKRWKKKSFDTEKFFFPWYIQPEYQLNGDHIKGYTKDEKELIQKVKSQYGITINKHQIAWRRAMIDEFDHEFAQEFPEDPETCFLATGSNPFDQTLISKMYEAAPEPIEDDGKLKIWAEYDKNDRYVIGADVAQGVRSDYSVADVFSVKTKKQVAQLRTNTLKPFAFADEIYSLAKLYHAGGRGWPLVAVELNNHGHAVNGRLHEEGYPNLYEYKEDTPGWLTNSVTRPKMIDTFIEAVESGIVTIKSDDTLGECLTLVDNGGKIEAEDGYHDDTIISGAIAVQMLIEDAPSDVYDNLENKIFM